MKTVYLHVGLHKTGTTSLQGFWHANAAALRRCGIEYPSLDRRQAHHNLAWELVENSRFERKGANWKMAARAVSKAAADRVLFSSEDFCFCRPEQIAKIKTYLGDYPVKIILVIRNQVDLIQSMYSEIGKKMPTPGIDKFIDSQININKRLKFYSIYERWENQFGKDNIIVLPFEGMRGDVVRYVMNSVFPDIDMDSLHVESTRRNMSRSYEYIKICQLLMKTIPPDVFKKEISPILRSVTDKDEKYLKKGDFMTTAQAAGIITACREENRRLAEVVPLPGIYFEARPMTPATGRVDARQAVELLSKLLMRALSLDGAEPRKGLKSILPGRKGQS